MDVRGNRVTGSLLHLAQVGRLDADGKIMSEWILGEKGLQGVYWIHLVQERDQWQALVNTVMNLQVP
jgi:hypothetical protein